MLTGDGREDRAYDLVVPLNQRTEHVNVHGIALDFSAWPLVQVTPPPYSLSDDALLEFMDFHRQRVRSMDSPHVLLLDLRNCNQMSGAQRKKLTDLHGHGKDKTIASCLGTALVFDSLMLRGMLNAVFWFFKPPYPVKVVPDLESAQRWLASLLPNGTAKAA